MLGWLMCGWLQHGEYGHTPCCEWIHSMVCELQGPELNEDDRAGQAGDGLLTEAKFGELTEEHGKRIASVLSECGPCAKGFT